MLATTHSETHLKYPGAEEGSGLRQPIETGIGVTCVGTGSISKLTAVSWGLRLRAGSRVDLLARSARRFRTICSSS